jgi:hypothetical protein
MAMGNDSLLEKSLSKDREKITYTISNKFDCLRIEKTRNDATARLRFKKERKKLQRLLQSRQNDINNEMYLIHTKEEYNPSLIPQKPISFQPMITQ